PVTRIGVGRGIRPPYADARRPRVPAAELPAHLDRFLAELSRAGHFNGSVAVWRGGRPLLEKGYGMADRDAALPNTVRT
ncbi:hypothetical protein ACC743_39770, partial [Rhizobium ruizarguesonis]